MLRSLSSRFARRRRKQSAAPAAAAAAAAPTQATETTAAEEEPEEEEEEAIGLALSIISSVGFPSTILPDYPEYLPYEPRRRSWMSNAWDSIRWDWSSRVRDCFRRICRLPPSEGTTPMREWATSGLDLSAMTPMSSVSGHDDEEEREHELYCLCENPPAYTWRNPFASGGYHPASQTAGEPPGHPSPLELDMLRDPGLAQRVTRGRERHREFQQRALETEGAHVPPDLIYRRPRPHNPPSYNNMHPRSIYPRTGPPAMVHSRPPRQSRTDPDAEATAQLGWVH